VPAAVRALPRELGRGDAEDGGQSLNLLGGESALPAVAAAFGRAHGGVAGPAHQFADLGLIPAVLLAKDRMFAPTTADCFCGISSTRRNRPGITHPPAR